MAIQFLGTMPRNDPSNTPLALEIAKSVERGMIMEEERQQKDRLRDLQLLLASAEGVPQAQRGAFRTKLATALVDLRIPTDIANLSADYWVSKVSESDLAQQKLEMQETLAKAKALQEAIDKQKQADTRLATIASQTDFTGRLVKLPEAAINAIAELSGASPRARNLALGIHGFAAPAGTTPASTTQGTPPDATRPMATSAEVEARSVPIPSPERQKQLGIVTGAKKQPSSSEKRALDWLYYSAARLQSAKTPEEKRIFTEDVQAAKASLDKARGGMGASASPKPQKLDSTESKTSEATTPTPIDITKLSQESRNTLEAMRRVLPYKIYKVIGEAQKTPGVYHWDEGTLNYVRWVLGISPKEAAQFLILSGYNPDPKAPVLYFKEERLAAPESKIHDGRVRQ